jgi:stage II sporulation protein D
MRWAVLVLLCTSLAAGSCRPGEPTGPTPPPAMPPPAVPPPGLPTAEPRIRVGISIDTTAAVVGAPAAFEIRDAGGAVIATGSPQESWTIVPDASGRLQARASDGRAATGAPPLRVSARSGDIVTLGGRPFRGEVLVLQRGEDRVTAINVVDLEAYLLGVVPREIGRRPANEIEAMKAQAVAARTYAIGNLGGRESQGFDFYATILDQVYGGLADEDSIVSRAVRETRGQIVSYRGQPILAYYSSTCGGRTAAIEDSWPWRGPLPYLRSVSDMIPGTDQAYCGFSSRYTWETRWTRPQLLAVLGETLRTHTGGRIAAVRRVDDVEMVGRTDSGRVTVRVTADGEAFTLRADSVRWVLRPQVGPAILNSSLLSLVRATRTGGEVDALEVRGGGWGHGIGMCQVGAMGRARAGQRYDQILRAYYTDTDITRLY